MSLTESYTLLSPSRLTEIMHNAGVRPSVQRIAVLSHIANLRRHPTADEIYTDLVEEFPSMSRTTVYNSLHALTSGRLVKELEIESGNRHYDFALQPPHGHFICRRCGRITDVEIPDGIGLSLMSGFRADSMDVYFKGICKDCTE